MSFTERGVPEARRLARRALSVHRAWRRPFGRLPLKVRYYSVGRPRTARGGALPAGMLYDPHVWAGACRPAPGFPGERFEFVVTGALVDDDTSVAESLAIEVLGCQPTLRDPCGVGSCGDLPVQVGECRRIESGRNGVAGGKDLRGQR